MSSEKNMRLVTTYWGEHKTFKMMPITNECPFMEVIYDPNTDLLVVITKNTKENLQMVPKLDDDGNNIKAKKPKSNGKPWKEKQIAMTVPQEFYLIEREEQVALIKKFAENADEYDYNSFFKDLTKELEKKAIYTGEDGTLLDDKGMPMKGKPVAKMEIETK